MKFLVGNIIAFFPEGEAVPDSLTPLAALPLVILVGLTGVGKTTALKQVRQQGLDFTLLPDRRLMTDEIIIAGLQLDQGVEPHPVTDRLERFDYTARYRARFPGGMAHALSHIAVNIDSVNWPLLFDGLRGLEEVQSAAANFPQARFILLDAPDTVRLSRLLERGDTFDITAAPVAPASPDLVTALLAVPGIQTVFTPEQLAQIAGTAGASSVSLESLVQKISIIVEERHNYDSAAARDYLASHVEPERVLVVDTAGQPSEAVAGAVVDWLRQQPELKP